MKRLHSEDLRLVFAPRSGNALNESPLGEKEQDDDRHDEERARCRHEGGAGGQCAHRRKCVARARPAARLGGAAIFRWQGR